MCHVSAEVACSSWWLAFSYSRPDFLHNTRDRLHIILQQYIYWLFRYPLSPAVRRAGPGGSRSCRWGRPGGIHTGPAAAWRPCFFWVLIFLVWALTTLTGATWIPDTPETGKCNFMDDFNRMVLSDCSIEIDRPGIYLTPLMDLIKCQERI